MHLPHRRRQNLGHIHPDFAGDIWGVEFARNLSVDRITMLNGARFAGRRLRVNDLANGEPVEGWEWAAMRLGLR